MGSSGGLSVYLRTALEPVVVVIALGRSSRSFDCVFFKRALDDVDHIEEISGHVLLNNIIREYITFGFFSEKN